MASDQAAQDILGKVVHGDRGGVEEGEADLSTSAITETIDSKHDKDQF